MDLYHYYDKNYRPYYNDIGAEFMETFRQFTDRINSFEKREIELGDGYFACNPSVALKVDNDNKFKPFYGDTVVFDLDGQTKTVLTECVDSLYGAAPQCFCERLGSGTFHVTLHDLCNSPLLSDVAEDTFRNELKIAGMREELARLSGAKIRLKSTYIFNMVGTSLVLGLRPADEADHGRLSELYSAVDGVKKLSYPFTPHITLAYYNVGGFDARAAAALTKEVNRLNGMIDMDVTLGDLYYQKFTGMNDYVDIMNLSRPSR